eukprot:COSAG01_NODE_1052_length_11920_cov_6.553760_7_plen_41_part_00
MPATSGDAAGDFSAAPVRGTSVEALLVVLQFFLSCAPKWR